MWMHRQYLHQENTVLPASSQTLTYFVAIISKCTQSTHPPPLISRNLLSTSSAPSIARSNCQWKSRRMDQKKEGVNHLKCSQSLNRGQYCYTDPEVQDPSLLDSEDDSIFKKYNSGVHLWTNNKNIKQLVYGRIFKLWVIGKHTLHHEMFLGEQNMMSTNT